MSGAPAADQERVLLLAPTAADAALSRSILAEAGLTCHACAGLRELCQDLEEGAGAMLLTEEALGAGGAQCLGKALGRQPPWSDVPILLLSAARTGSPVAAEAMELLGNVTVLEQPVRVTTLVSALQAALRARHRQYQVRDQLSELEQAAKARALHAAIVDFSDDAIISKTLEGIILTWNAAAERLFGYSEREAVGQSIRLIIPPDKQDEESAILERLRQGQRIEHFETVRVSKQGQRLDVSLTVSPLRDGSGRVIGASKVARDITARKRDAEALRKSEERFRFLAQSVPSIIWTAAPDGTITYANDQWFQYCGLSPHENARGWPELVVHPDDRQRCLEEWNRALRDGTEYEIEVRNRRHDGVFRWFVTRAAPLKDGEGRVTAWFGVTLDIHDQKEMQQRLREADRRKDEFLATLAHELRNPLAPIRNSLQIMQLADGDGALIGQARSMMERQLGQMVRLIDDLLDVSRISRGKLELRKERVDLAAVLRNAVETARPLIEAAGHKLNLTLPRQPIHLDADPVRLAQVFSNLLNNAAKYMDRGGQIWLAAEREEEEVAVTVRDAGIGIPAESLLSIFDMFSQVDRSLERAHGGLGIGLTLVKQLVEMHGGSVHARSEGSGTGSEFTVRLPAVSRPPAAPAPRGHAARRGIPVTFRILVADDNQDSAESMGTLLRLMGHEVRTVRDGVQALKEAAEFRPDVILMDIGMPLMNGYDTARRIREQRWGQGVVLVALTGWGQDQDKRRARETGFDLHFTKPLNPRDLEQLLAGLSADSGLRDRRLTGR